MYASETRARNSAKICTCVWKLIKQIVLIDIDIV